MKDTFILKQNLGLLEYVNATCYFALRMRNIQWIFFLVLALGLMSNFLGLVTGAKVDWWNAILSPVVTFVIFSFCGVIVLAIICLLIRLFRPAHFKNVTYTFTHWGMEKSGEGFLFTRQWNKFTGFRESRNFFFLYISDNDAHMLPKRLFANEDEVSEFRNFILEHLQKRG